MFYLLKSLIFKLKNPPKPLYNQQNKFPLDKK